MSFFGGMPLGFADLLRRKYDIMQQDANTRLLGTTADANLANVRAGLMPAESKANIGLTTAQTGRTGAEQKRIEEETKFVAPLARSSIGLNSAQSRNLDATAGLTRAETEGVGQMNRMQRISIGGTNPYQEAVSRFFRFGL